MSFNEEELGESSRAEASSIYSIASFESLNKISVSISPSLKPPYLASPRDPIFWREATPFSRFGLDIGGTLCKVVHFEPLRGSGNDAKQLYNPKNWVAEMQQASSADGGFGRGDAKKQMNLTERRVVANGYNLIGEDSVDRRSLPSNDAEDNKQIAVGLDENGKGYQEDETKAGDAETNEFRERSRKENFRKQFSKIWVSNYEPVFLPGRGTLHFRCFETWRMEEFLSLTKELLHLSKDKAIGATGGGARKFSDRFLEIAGLRLQRADELRSLVRGIDFLVRHAEQESFEYLRGPYRGGEIQRPLLQSETSSDDGNSDHSGDERTASEKERISKAANPCSLSAVSSCVRKDCKSSKDFESHGSSIQQIDNLFEIRANEGLYPYLVVNIGSGVSILRVDSAERFERVGGTSLGGSTFLGLAAALTGCESFEEAIHLAREGDSTQIDMLVGDIYGGDYKEMNLASTTVASSFGKLVHPEKRSAAMKKPHHLAKAALLMVTNNIGSIAMLHARAAGVQHVMFTGSFLHGNELAMRLLAVAMDFWSKGSTQAIFLRHEGHAGAVGALLNTLQMSDPIGLLLLDERATVTVDPLCGQ